MVFSKSAPEQQQLRRPRRWAAGVLQCSSVQATSSGCCKRVDRYLIVPRALRRPRLRPGASQASIVAYMQAKQERVKMESQSSLQRQDKKWPCRRQDGIAINLEDDAVGCDPRLVMSSWDLRVPACSEENVQPKLEIEKPATPGMPIEFARQRCAEQCSELVKTVGKSSHEIQSEVSDWKLPKHVATEDISGRPVNRWDEDSEPDSEPGIQLTPVDDMPRHCPGTQPDSEPETEGVCDTVSMESNRNAVACQHLMNSMTDLHNRDVSAWETSERIAQCIRTNDIQAASEELEKLHQHLDDTCSLTRQSMLAASPDKVLQRAREAGATVGRALEHVSRGEAGCAPHGMGLTLAAELCEFADFAADMATASTRRSDPLCSTDLGLDTLRGRTLQVLGNVAEVASEFWNEFGGIESYVSHLQQVVLVQHADRLCGCAAWQRLLLELEAATLLADPIQPPSSTDSDSPECLSVAFAPMHRRLCYVAARVAWALECQARDALTWMQYLVADAGRSASFPSSQDFASVHESLQACPIIRDLLHAALRDAAARAAAELLASLDKVLTSASQHSGQQLKISPVECPARFSGLDRSRRQVLLERVRRHSAGNAPLCFSQAQRSVDTMKEQLAAEVVASARSTLVDFRERWLVGEIDAMGLGRRHREAVDRRHQALRYETSRSEATLRVLRQVAARLRA